MSKLIEINVGKWSGSVLIANPINIPQAKLFEDGIQGIPKEKIDAEGKYYLTAKDEMMLPCVIACVEKWELANFPEKVTAQNFPASPRQSSHELLRLIFQEIGNIYSGDATVPNE